MADQNRIEVTIAGTDYKIYSPRDMDEMKAIIAYVENKIEESKGPESQYNRSMPITLAALQIAEELYDLKDQYEDLLQEAQEPMDQFRPNQEKIKDLEKKNREVEAAKNQLSKDLEGKDKNLGQIRKEKAALDKDLKSAHVRLEKLEDQVLSLQENLSKLESKNVDLAKQLQEQKRTQG